MFYLFKEASYLTKKKSVVDYKKMQTTMVPNPSSCLLHLSQA